jgi:hypothetical protein
MEMSERLAAAPASDGLTLQGEVLKRRRQTDGTLAAAEKQLVADMCWAAIKA